ncbi:hypothetical protein [Sphingomonas sp. GV3]|nr:hypothetical protein [Sphingomonas sp. GV3]
MDPLIIVLPLLLVLLVGSIRMAGSEKRRRRQAWAAYYRQPDSYGSKR